MRGMAANAKAVETRTALGRILEEVDSIAALPSPPAGDDERDDSAPAV